MKQNKKSIRTDESINEMNFSILLKAKLIRSRIVSTGFIIAIMISAFYATSNAQSCQPSDWTGNWDTTYNRMRLFHLPGSSVVQGNYDVANHFLLGNLSSLNCVLEGTWQHNKNTKGRFRFTMNPSTKTFAGTWDNGILDQEVRRWTGKRATSHTTEDLMKVVDNAGFWSRSSTVFDTTIGGYDKFKDRDAKLSNFHVQGITYTQSKRFVISQSLDPRESDTNCSMLAWSSPYIYGVTKGSELTWKSECFFSNWHPSMLQSAGDLIVATDNHQDNFKECDDKGENCDAVTKRKVGNRLRFISLASGNPVELRHLGKSYEIDPKKPLHGANAVAITYRKADGHYYLIRSYPSDHNYDTIEIWKDQLSVTQNGPCVNLEITTCRFVRVGEITPVYVSSSGLSLVDQSNGKLVLLAMYSPDGVPDDFIRATEIDLSKMTFKELSSNGENLGISQVQSKFNRPSCRYGCSFNVIDGDLFFVLSARDIGSSGNLELGIHKVIP